MYMPKLGTMRLRNKSAYTRVITGVVFLTLCGLLAAQTSQTPSNEPSLGHSTQPPPGQTQPAGGQGPTANDSGVFIFRTQAQEVTLHATVVDERNRLVTNLAKPDFTVFENNQPQQIRTFRQEDFPVAMGIVIDNSGSMREKRDEVNKAAVNLVRASNS